MYMTVENRKKLQTILENVLFDTGDGIARVDPETQQNLYLLSLSLIYELNAKDSIASVNFADDEDLCLCRRFLQVMADLAGMKVPDASNLEFIRQFTKLATNLGNLSSEVNHLLELLSREYANKILTAVPDSVTKQ